MTRSPRSRLPVPLEVIYCEEFAKHRRYARIMMKETMMGFLNRFDFVLPGDSFKDILIGYVTVDGGIGTLYYCDAKSGSKVHAFHLDAPEDTLEDLKKCAKNRCDFHASSADEKTHVGYENIRFPEDMESLEAKGGRYKIWLILQEDSDGAPPFKDSIGWPKSGPHKPFVPE